MQNDEAARFTTHWIQAQPTVFAFVSSSIRGYSDTEDIVQRVATQAIAKFDQFDNSRPFINWVIGFARLEVLRYLRDSGTDRHRFVADALPQITDTFCDLAPELDDRRRLLHDCLGQIKGRAKQVLQLRYGNGLKSSAIAESLGVATGSVSRILSKAYVVLRECISKKLATEGTT